MRRAGWIRNESVAVILAVLAAGCASSGESATGQVELEALGRAEQVASALGRDLMGRLTSEIKSGGPVSAVQVCSEVAQDLAASHSRDGLTVRRVTRKPRNPADAPDPFEREVLEKLQELANEGRLPDSWFEFVEGKSGRRLRYLRPIKIMPTCLPCHGPAETLDPDVAQLLAVRYPNDQALGYAAGDLRGAISVTVSLD